MISYLDPYMTIRPVHRPFIFKANVIAGVPFTIPTEGGGYNYSVKVNDALVAEHVTGDYIYWTPTSGQFTFEVAGHFPRIYFNNAGNKEDIIEIVQWGDIKWESFAYAFFGCANLDVTATDIPDLSRVNSLERMFAACTSLVFNPSINDWDVSNVTVMRHLFWHGSSVFNQPMGQWDVSRVVDMTAMFSGEQSFNQDIGSWNVGKVTNMNSMFANCSDFNQDLSGWDVGRVKDMGDLFLGASSFNQDIGSWNVGKVTNMNSMFANCSSFNQDLSGWCVINFAASPFNFDYGTPIWTLPKPIWGTCPP